MKSTNQQAALEPSICQIRKLNHMDQQVNHAVAGMHFATLIPKRWAGVPLLWNHESQAVARRGKGVRGLCRRGQECQISSESLYGGGHPIETFLLKDMWAGRWVHPIKLFHRS
ncbi:hypothetical protein BsWGS_04830 [Bradybaena similaris]